mgnify:FL=1
MKIYLSQEKKTDLKIFGETEVDNVGGIRQGEGTLRNIGGQYYFPFVGPQHFEYAPEIIVLTIYGSTKSNACT